MSSDGWAGSFTEIADGRRRLGLTPMALWIAYFEVGGNATLGEVEGWLAGASQPSDRDHNFIAQALNDHFVELGLDHPMRYRLR
jgi:hypothetical protein